MEDLYGSLFHIVRFNSFGLELFHGACRTCKAMPGLTEMIVKGYTTAVCAAHIPQDSD